MALPSGGGEQNFIATVAVVVDESTLVSVGVKIKDALDKAVGSVSPSALKGLTEGLTLFTKEQEKAILQAEKIKQAIEKTTAAEEKTAQAKAKTTEASARLAAAEERRQRAQDALQAKFDSSLQKLNQMYTVESQISTKNQEQIQAESALAQSLSQQNVLLNEQAAIQGRLAATKPNLTNPNFSIGNLLGTIGGNFQANVLSGQSIGGAASSALTQLQQSLYQVSLGGEKATAAFANLGIEGVGAVSGLTTGLAGLGAGLLALVPLAVDFGKAILGAYESQKELVFQSGLLSKQLGLSAEQGAKIRSLLTLVGQEDNIFATITLSQIQASIAGLDRVEKGLEKASPQVEKFGKALSELGVSYKNQNGSLKDFTGIVVELSAALEKLPAAQRSLAIQNLAGLFGGDVAKLFGFGPELLTKTLQSAVAVSGEAQAANDRQRESLVELTNAQLEFNLALTSGLTPLETWTNQFKAGALREGADILGEIFSRITGINAAALEGKAGDIGASLVRNLSNSFGAIYGNLPAGLVLRAIFPSEEELRGRANELKNILGGGLDAGFTVGELAAADAELAKIQARLREIASGRLGGRDQSRGLGALIPDPKEIGPSVEGLKALDKALGEVEKAEKDVAKAQEAIVKNNLDVAKAFDAQINALQKTASGYDQFYEKVAGIQSKITALEAKQGKPFSYFGEGGKVTQDLPLAIVNLKVLEERFDKLDSGKFPARAEKLALQIERARQALGITAGEPTALESVDTRFGISKLSDADLKKLKDLTDQLTELKKSFLQGGFDVAQSSFGLLAQTLADLPDFKETFLAGGARTLQDYADSLGLFASPGFAQAIGESALQAKLLAGGFGEINTAAGAAAAFDKYVEAFGDLRSELFDLSKYIADPSLLNIDSIFQDLDKWRKSPNKLEIPIAIKLGLVTFGEVDLAQQYTPNINVGSVADAIEEQATTAAQQAQEQAARDKLAGLTSGQGIVGAILAQYGVTPGEAIKASLDFTLDLKADNTLAEKQLEAQKKLADELSEAKNINAKWNLKIDFTSNIGEIREKIQDILDNLPTGTGGALPKTDIGGTLTPRPVDQNDPELRRAAGGHVLHNIPFFGNEEGRGELYMAGRDGYILPGNDTANLLRGLGSRERLPQANIHYAPVMNQTLNVDARGTNAREVTQAIQRTQAKQSLFTSSRPFLRDRDFLRAHGLR